MKKTAPNHYELIEHTADIGIRAHADSREGLLEQFGFGLAELLYGKPAVQPLQRQEIGATGNSPEETLVNWLNELLYLMADKGLIPAEIIIKGFSGQNATAEVTGEHLDPERHSARREVKAVTYHQTSVSRAGDTWEAIVYLDV